MGLCLQQTLLLEQVKHNNRLHASLRELAIPAIRKQEYVIHKEGEGRKLQYRRYDKLKKKQMVGQLL
jgi:hypothetical protein